MHWHLQTLAKSPFKFERSWAAVLPGSSEGIYGFVAANYASGALQQSAPDPETFLGVVELGGASLQVLSFTYGLGYSRARYISRLVTLNISHVIIDGFSIASSIQKLSIGHH